jgi:TIR domain
VPGERLEDQIMEAIHELDRLLVVLSPHSMTSDWVKKEVQLAWNHRRDSLLPIRLCAIEEIDTWTAASQMPDLGEEFPIQDFSAWQEASSYEHALHMLMKAFTGGILVQPTQRRRSTPGKTAKPKRCVPVRSRWRLR